MIENTPISTKHILGLGDYNYYTPSTYIPTITNQDYEYGYIKRYFVGRINYFDVKETCAKDFNLSNSSFYKKIQITWKISGPEFNQYEGKMLQTTGVVNFNILRIVEVKSIFPSIDTILDNPKQYWRGF